MLKSPNVTLKAPFASSLGKPMADSTCDGLLSPDEQAEPPDAHIPTASNFNSNSPEFILLKLSCSFLVVVVLDFRLFGCWENFFLFDF